jgi:hypothetical protein
MTIARLDANSQLASRLTIVSYPAEIVACLLPELNWDPDQLNRMPVILSNSNLGDRPGLVPLVPWLRRIEQCDEPAR